MNAPDRLAELQQWLLGNITDIGGIESHVGALDGKWTRDLILPSKQQTSEQRLETYSHAYYARLAECLCEMFPILTATLGREEFMPFANGYLDRYPPGSYTLNDLADHFPDYLAETRPRDIASPGWPDFLVELARLELAIEQIFDGPGTEELTPLDVDRLSEFAPDQLADLRFTPAPCLRLFKFEFPINDHYTAVKRGESPAWPEPHTTQLAITRRDYVVRRVPLEVAEYQVLSALVGGEMLGEALSGATQLTGEQITKWFADWGRLRLFAECSWTRQSSEPAARF
jgi:hypothetical protein